MAFKLGDEVLAAWADDGFRYPAIIVGLDAGTAHVVFLDGDEADVPEGELRNGAFGPGLSVSVNWKGQKAYYSGTILRRVGNALEMSYEDGTGGWTTISQCRVKEEIAAVLPPEKLACTYCGTSMTTSSATCPSCNAPRPGPKR